MILKWIYKIRHKGVLDENIPYWYCRSLFEEFWHLVRKGICQNIAPNVYLHLSERLYTGFVDSK